MYSGMGVSRALISVFAAQEEWQVLLMDTVIIPYKQVAVAMVM